MVRLTAKRLASAIPLLLGLLTIIFLISRLAPGDPVSLHLSPTVPAQVGDELRRQFGLDQPLFTQYVHWLFNAVQGNLGISFSHQRPVIQVIAQFLPNTAILGVAAIVLELMFGILLGALAVRYHGSIIDKFVTNTGLVVYTLPTFWVGFLLLAVLAYAFGFFPSSQMHSVNSEAMTPSMQILDLLKHLFLPACTIATPAGAGIAKYFRSSLMRVQREEYVVAARSMGVRERTVFLLYELPNAVAPVITILGLELGTLLAGAIVTETMFAWPGMGRLAVMAIFSRDYPLVLGCTLVSGVVVILGNLIADILYSIVDPRIRVPS
jgi:peptide/nickel transport system permease protein